MESEDIGVSFSNDKAVVKVEENCNSVCIDDHVVLYESDCTCGSNRLLRQMLTTSCPTPYEVKLQSDGNITVRPENANNNSNLLWKSDKRNEPGKYAFVVNSNTSEKRYQVWELENNGCPRVRLWDSIDDKDLPNCYGS
mmetsp:Transcript_518/g.594  ORF Transcript_518/g.594 Transcript_518/m.594 type:complete len:139 (-) Transcript_518:71-487(-)|eukprot:CAMPEP_0195248786 /NCGR_PEP_ID=MMETSP0706-20130129/1738_1 /TAXON_ID=33640 /ORGANISM="Asterionellopsis glacialis, Strain CCMP134" /LENGTH=138 /DNA_ID=CAMNT_0040300485 /DNA_START=431 /DNA_END=847 /DNA_ORIENTATION=+